MVASIKAPTHRRDTQLGTVRHGTISNYIAVNGVRYRPVPYRAEYRVCVWEPLHEFIQGLQVETLIMGTVL
jgi:hypothetical protein